MALGQGPSAALHYSTAGQVDGIIFLTACLCGPDAIIGELLEKYMARMDGALCSI